MFDYRYVRGNINHAHTHTAPSVIEHLQLLDLWNYGTVFHFT